MRQEEEEEGEGEVVWWFDGQERRVWEGYFGKLR